jgi:hypothetical protein
VLRLRGIFVLHASAVAIGDRALALAGQPGAGKSTTAAAFALLGYPVLSEDVVPVFEQGDILVVHAGYPHIRLWPDSVKLLLGSSDALPRIIPSWDKCRLDLTQNGFRLQIEPLPLSAR